MSATSEKLVEQINLLEEKISTLRAAGQDVESLLEERKILTQQLQKTVTALNEGKVLRG